MANATTKKKSLVSIVWSDKSGQRHAFSLDLSDSEQVTSDVETTDNPLETGATASDHVHFKPATVRVEGVVVDFPLKSAPRNLLGEASFGYVGRASASVDRLLQLQASATLFEVHTRTRVYTNMLLQSVGGRRAKGAAVSLSLAFREIRFANSQIVQIKRTNSSRTKPSQNGGHKTPDPATPAEENKSFGAMAADFLAGKGLKVPPAFLKVGVK